MLSKTIEIEAPRSEVWSALTTVEGVRKFFAPDAKIDLTPGGCYEVFFMLDAPEGARGGEGCKVLEVVAGKRLAITWNFPPSIPSMRDEHTRVTIEVSHLEGFRTSVILVASGWKNGPDWDEGYAYFDRAWTLVLERLKHSFEVGPIDWDDPWYPEAMQP